MSEVAAAADAAERSYTLLRESCGLLTSSPIRLIEVKGDDRKAWLQGQITNDMRQLGPAGSMGACMCSPTGQMVAALRLWHLNDAYFLATHRDALQAVMGRFDQMVIMEDVEARSMDELQLASVQGPEATRWLAERLDLPTMDAAYAPLGPHQILALRADHSGLGGWDLWYAPEAAKDVATLLQELEPIDDSGLKIAQLESGIPRWNQDMNAKTLPPEMGPAFSSRMIHYQKGCYTGQEVLMRIHSRGHTNKTWVGLYTDEVVPEGSLVRFGSRDDAGVVTASGFSPKLGPIAAAMMRNEAAHDGEVVVVQTPNGPVESEVRAMPLFRLE